MAINIAFLGLVFSAFYLRINTWFANKTLVHKTVHGSIKDFAIGLIVGLLASLMAGHALAFMFDHSIDYSAFQVDLALNLTANIFPATIEEVAFRGGLVHFASAYWGPLVGLGSGSVPFGLLHLFGAVFGHPVTFQHVIGVSMAGLLLSLLYLRFGLLSAISCHWIWNVLCSQWVTVLRIPKRGGVQYIEGAWTTTWRFSFFVFWFGYTPKRRPEWVICPPLNLSGLTIRSLFYV
jgi:membrane protease YdiL (CAAX protease family)